jgi:hypothetical protein
MAIKTLDTTALAAETGNLYETVAILSRRATQISAKTKQELDAKLVYFEDLSMDPADEIRSNEDQLRISLEYERKPKASAAAIEEFETGGLYFRNPTPADPSAEQQG